MLHQFFMCVVVKHSYFKYKKLVFLTLLGRYKSRSRLVLNSTDFLSYAPSSSQFPFPLVLLRPLVYMSPAHVWYLTIFWNIFLCDMLYSAIFYLSKNCNRREKKWNSWYTYTENDVCHISWKSKPPKSFASWFSIRQVPEWTDTASAGNSVHRTL